MKLNWKKIAAMMIVRQCWNGGATITQLAKKTGKSQSTIRRWLKATGAYEIGGAK